MTPTPPLLKEPEEPEDSGHPMDDEAAELVALHEILEMERAIDAAEDPDA